MAVVDQNARIPKFNGHQFVLISSTLVASWLGMQAVHELGHIIGAWATGGEFANVVLHPMAISRTDLSSNPSPAITVWMGPVLGVLFPLVVWRLSAALRMPGAFVLRFFAGFSLIANGVYIAIGSFSRVGDCDVMLRNGSAPWQLWLFGLVTVPLGFGLWHRQGKYFGLGPNAEPIRPLVAYGCLTAALCLILFGLYVGR
jgi:hypothetical protein